MSIQGDSRNKTASASPVSLPGDDAPAPPPAPSNTLIAYLAPHLPRRTPVPALLPAELTSLHVVTLPRAPARQRPQLLTFAIEDSLGAPVDKVAVTEMPRRAPGGAALALVVDRALVAGLDAPHLPEVLVLPRPGETDDWHVWRDGARVLVRAGDGTGFAVRYDALGALWRRAGRPALIALNEGLDDLPHVTAPPPKPDMAEIASRLYPAATDPARHAWRPLKIAAGVAFLALGLHLGILAADVWALGPQAEAARREAQAALDPVLPGIAVSADTGPILTRLAPRAATPDGSDLVPMMSEVSSVLVSTGAGISMRRVSWGGTGLSALILAPRLEDLQQAEEALNAAGFSVRAGAAIAGEGGAEVEMTIERAAS